MSTPHKKPNSPTPKTKPNYTPPPTKPTAKWIPWIVEVEIYNTGGFKEKKQIGWLCSKCKKGKEDYKRKYCPDCGRKMEV